MSVKTSPPSRARPRAAADHPSGDPRFSLIDRTLKRFSFQQDALIEVLHTAQEAFGFLSDDLLIYVAHQLKLPLSWVYGVATFYHFFTLTPQGKHNCIVCMGTACYVKRAAEIVAALQQEYNVAAGGTTADGQFSLSTARCLGSCGLAPVLVLDGEVLPRETPETTLDRVRQHLIGHAGNGAAKTAAASREETEREIEHTNGGSHEPI